MVPEREEQRDAEAGGAAEPSFLERRLNNGDDPPPAPEEDPELRACIEAALIVSPDPLTARELGNVLDVDGTRVRRLMEELKREYDRQERGFQLMKISGGFKITTRECHYPWLQELFGSRTLKRLSDSALETLVIVAYNQPVTRSEVESLRGVNSQSVLQTLLEKDFVRISGRRDEIGRPFEYRTTQTFLDYFGLNTLNDLPDESDLEDVLGDLT